MIAVSMSDAARVLNTLGRRIRAGADLLPGELISVEDWPHRIFVEELPNPGEIVFSANRHYWRPAEVSVPVLQLSYDDQAGRFPWEPDYRHRTCSRGLAPSGPDHCPARAGGRD
jgi:hypothetical protein